MKKIFIITIILSICSSSCQDPFELTPQDIIVDIYEDENLTDAALADLYQRSQFQIVSGQEGFDMNTISSFGGESRNYAPWQGPYGSVVGVTFDAQRGAGYIARWPYDLIRETNDFIEQLSASSLDENFVKKRAAEARFIRAWAYFDMVKLYGGVPLITTVQDPETPTEELYVSRNSEKEIYDFIGSEMDAIVQDLPTVPEQEGRITRWAALAFKSRAMLYAASVAQFGGGTQLDGLLGFPASDANNYYQQSLAASQEIIMTGPFELYRRNADPVQNFIDLFTDENENPEVIFAEKWDAVAGKGHSWDLLGVPDGLGGSWNSNHPVYAEVLALFDFMDGTPGNQEALYDDTTPVDFDWFFGQRDPRMRASISYPEMEYWGQTVYYHSSTIYTDPVDGLRKTTNDPSFIIPGSDAWPGAGASRNVNSNVTSLQIRKRLDESLTATGSGLSSTDFYVFRLGEVLLNYVEAAYYLGDPNGDMLSALNNLRDRAGMPLLTLAEVTEDEIRKERRCELAFEEHVFWDLRRWRIAHTELDNVTKHRFFFRYDYDLDSYYISTADGDGGRVRSHPERNYYYSLGLGRLADNPNLVDNPGY